jgi:hypothetical protein
MRNDARDVLQDIAGRILKSPQT